MIYLAGPIKEAADNGAIWRNTLKVNHLDKQFYDPLAHLDATTQDVDSETVVKADKAGLNECDGVLVGYRDVQSVGTPMEVMYAYERDLPIALWVRDDTKIAGLSDWYRYHTFPTQDVDQALDYLERHQ
jgi:nucleoside 2-deoxyribosyltransferase